MSRVIIKSEIHTSREDLYEEIELLDDVDAVVLEGQDTNFFSGISLTNAWFLLSVYIPAFVFSIVYAPKELLKANADGRGIPVIRTRDGINEIVENTPIIVQILVFFIFLGLLAYSLFLGLSGETYRGAMYLLTSGVFPLLILRFVEMSRFSSAEPRDDLIANKALDCIDDGADSVLVIVGAAHSQNVRSHIPDTIDVETIDTSYNMISFSHLKDVFGPMLHGFGGLLVIYMAIMWVVENALFLIEYGFL